LQILIFVLFKLLLALLGLSWPFLGRIWAQNGPRNLGPTNGLGAGAMRVCLYGRVLVDGGWSGPGWRENQHARAVGWTLWSAAKPPPCVRTARISSGARERGAVEQVCSMSSGTRSAVFFVSTLLLPFFPSSFFFKGLLWRRLGRASGPRLSKGALQTHTPLRHQIITNNNFGVVDGIILFFAAGRPGAANALTNIN
jgi:hypothetical protein